LFNTLAFNGCVVVATDS